ncbi:hypothetical protein IAU59_001922 [Kwoniella sp. CBS 9459]
MLLPSSFPKATSTPLLTSRPRDLYRSYLQHLRLIPDPHIWSVLLPRFKRLILLHSSLDSGHAQASSSGRGSGYDSHGTGVDDDDGPLPALGGSTYETPYPHAESSKNAKTRASVLSWRREKALKKAHKELRRLRAAVACHPHALKRLLEEAYGQSGVARWDLLRSISSPYDTSPPTDPLPPPLHPLRPPPKADKESQPRARKHTPTSTTRKEAERSLVRDWELVKPPIALPLLKSQPVHLPLREDEKAGASVASLGRMSSESDRMISNLRLLAGLDRPGHPSLDLNLDPRSKPPSPTIASQPPNLITIRESLDLAPLAALPTLTSLLFPRKLSPTLREPPLDPPRPKAVRQNPTTWSLPRRLDDRLLRRVYKRLWDSLVWVRPVTRTPSPSSYAGKAIEAFEAVEERWKKCSHDEMKAYNRGELELELETTGSDRSQQAESTKGQGKGKRRSKDRPSKRQKAKDAAAGVLANDVVDDGKWSTASEEERGWISRARV